MLNARERANHRLATKSATNPKGKNSLTPSTANWSSAAAVVKTNWNIQVMVNASSCQAE